MKSEYYILSDDGETPVPTSDIHAWGRFYANTAARRLRQDKVGGTTVSTVFLGLDHSYGKGPPVLWETMVFGGPMDEVQDRCSGTREQAEAMHARMVLQVVNAQRGKVP